MILPSFSLFNLKLRKIVYISFIFLSSSYLINLLLAYLGYDYSIYYNFSYFIHLVFLALFYVKIKLHFDKYLINFFLFCFLLSLMGIIITALSTTIIPIEIPLVFLLTGILLPFLISNLHLQYLKLDFNDALNIIFIYVIAKTSIYLILMPLELSTMQNGGFASLQFSGGQYHNVGILLFTLSYAHYFSVKKSILIILNIILLFTVLLCFSRTAFLLYLLLLSIYFFINIPKLYLKPSFKKYFLILLSIYLASCFFDLLNDNIFINDFLNYWTLRLNQSGYEFEFGKIFDDTDLGSGRGYIINLILEKSNFINLIFGYGIGTSQYLISSFTFGQSGFGSFHNLIATTIVERGIIFVALLIFYIIKMASNLFHNKMAFVFYFLFLIYSLTTGVELFLNSRDLNFDITLLFLLFIGCSRHYKSRLNLGCKYP